MPFIGTRRVVVLRDIEKTRARPGGARQLLEEYLASPSPETVFVVTTEDDDKGQDASVKQHGDAWVVVAFNPLKGAALATAVKAEAARLGCAIDAAAIAELIEVAGEDQARVFNELAKLRLAVGAGGAIDVAAVARYAAGYVHHGAFDIVDAISRRDLPGSLRLIGEVTIKDEEFLGLLGMLGKRLRVLWYLARRRARGAEGVPGLPQPARQAAARREALHARGDRTGPAGAGAARRPGQEHGGRAEAAAGALPAGLLAGALSDGASLDRPSPHPTSAIGSSTASSGIFAGIRPGISRKRNRGGGPPAAYLEDTEGWVSYAYARSFTTALTLRLAGTRDPPWDDPVWSHWRAAAASR